MFHWMITGVGKEYGPVTHPNVRNRMLMGSGWRNSQEVRAETLTAIPVEAIEPFLVGWHSGVLEELGWEFQTRDDDGEVAYTGVCSDLGEADQFAAFAPLDFAQTDVGATSLWYRKAGESEWKQL